MEPSESDVVAAVAEGLVDALEAFRTKLPNDPGRLLALGEAVGLLNLADRLGVVQRVRAEADASAGQNVYQAVSEAMRAVYGRGRSGGSSGSSRPPGSGSRRPPRRQ